MISIYYKLRIVKRIEKMLIKAKLRTRGAAELSEAKSA